MVMLSHLDLSHEDVLAELERRLILGSLKKQIVVSRKRMSDCLFWKLLQEIFLPTLFTKMMTWWHLEILPQKPLLPFGYNASNREFEWS